MVTYSRYGHGRSDPLTEARKPDYMHREALEILPALRRELGLDDVVLIGHSDGASIALMHAGAQAADGPKWPVRALILEAPHVFVEDFSERAITETRRIFETTDLGKKMARYHDDPDGVFWGWNKIWLAPEFRDWNIEEYLPGVTCPTLAIQGLDDEYSTMLQIDAIERQIGGPFERLELANCKHSAHRDQEAAVLAAMTGFVGRV